MRLIDRGALMIDYLNRLGKADSYKAKCEAIMQAVDNAPVVDAEPVKRGRWIVDGGRRSTSSKGEHYAIVICSECKTDGSPMWKRCPVCEAKMYGDAPKEE